MGGLLKLAMVMVAVVLFAGGCAGMTGVAGFRSTPSGYSVSGVTTTPENMVRVASDAHVRRYDAETYRWAVQNGAAYPYPGGGYGNDFSLFYGGPSGWVAPMVAPPVGYLPGGGYPATRDEVAAAQEQADRAASVAAEAHRWADDALAAHRILVEGERRRRRSRGGAR